MANEINTFFNISNIELDNTLSKADVYLRGYASLPNVDRDGERILKEGIDFSKYQKYGYLNYSHSHEPEDVIGIPVKTEVDDKGLKVLIKMLDTPKAKAVVDLVNESKKKGRPIGGLSVEGKIIERDPENPKVLKKVEVSWIAFSPDPINPETGKTLETFVKSFIPVYTGENKVDINEPKPLVNPPINTNIDPTMVNGDTSITTPVNLVEYAMAYHRDNPGVPLKKLMVMVKSDGFINLWDTILANKPDPDMIGFLVYVLSKAQDVYLHQDPRGELSGVKTPLQVESLEGYNKEYDNFLDELVKLSDNKISKEEIDKSFKEVVNSFNDLISEIKSRGGVINNEIIG